MKPSLLWATGAILLLVCVSLISPISGVHRCPMVGMLDGSTGYLVRRNGYWYSVSINGTGGPDFRRVSMDYEISNRGIWVVSVRAPDGLQFQAWATWNLIDLCQLWFGRYTSMYP